MEFYVKRVVGTKGRDENIIQEVVFPCNIEDLYERFGVNDAADLILMDDRYEKCSVKQFNYIMRDADARAAKIEDEINAVVRFLQKRMEKNPQYKGVSDVLALSLEDATIWNSCMKNDYRHPDEKVCVWAQRGNLTVFYGEKKN